MSPDEEPSHPSLALGTHEAEGHQSARASTKVASPNARSAPPKSSPPPVPTRTADDVDVEIGSVLGSYKVHELLGKGGMGYVFRAEHVKLGREVALKLLRRDYAKRRDAVARFFQEARTVNRVRHRNIVDVTDFVELPDQTTFIIMEFLRGQSLGKWARTGVDLPRALAVLVQICDGLAAAHQVGVIHRDLKPDNVIVVPTPDGAELVKLLDFGVAKLVNRDDEDVGFQTAAGSVIGTPAYMSPEQAGGMTVDARSDIYSLGAIMYELFCGQPMFRGRSFGEYVRKHLTEMPVAPHKTKAGASIDPRLEGLIMRCLEKDPNLRFSSILELRESLLGILGGMETMPPGFAVLAQSGIRPGPTVVPAMLPTVVPAGLPTVLPSGVQRLLPSAPITNVPTPTSHVVSLPYMPQQPKTPWWVWFGGGAVAVGIGIAAALWYAGRSEPPAEPKASEPQQAAAPQAPTAQPIEDSAPEPPPAPTSTQTLRFDSLPSGGVYADGKSAELCRTPCAFRLDLDDGSPKDRRRFIVRSEGFKDGIVDVDLAKPEREFRVTLERIETIAKPLDLEPADKTPRKKIGKTAKVTPKETRVEPKVEPKVEPQIKPPERPEIKTDPKPKKGTDKIDATETIDPFKRKKPTK